MNAASHLSPAELASLMHFYADAGVDYLLEDEPFDRFAEFAEAKNARANSQPNAQEKSAPPSGNGTALEQHRAKMASNAPRPAPTLAVNNMFIPDEQAVAAARLAADNAQTLAELQIAIEGFSGCNLKNSARNTVFAEGNPASGILIIGSMPDADDDREGKPFAGKAGALLDKMLAAINLTRENVLLTNAVPWRPPGNLSLIHI